MNRACMSVIAALVFCSWASSARAVKPEEWKHEQPKDFLAGKLQNVVVSSLGEVMLGRETKALDKLAEDVEVVNALARAGDGKIYAATGPTGRIYQFDGAAVKEFAKLPDGGNALSLLFAADGFLLAGTGGGDQAHIYRIDKSGKVSVFYDPPEAKYVWAMVRGPAGEIYAATGIQGKIYRIDAAGKQGSVLADLKPKNALCLAIGTNGMVYAGTDDEGLVCRISPVDGKVFVLYDAKETEISSIVLDADGNVYASTGSAESARPGRTVPDKPGGIPEKADTAATSKPSGSEAATDKAGKSSQHSTSKPSSQPTTTRNSARTIARSGGSETGNVIYRVDTEGFVTEVFREPVIILCMAENDGVIYAGTGNEGRVYAITPGEDRTTMLAKLDSAQVTSLVLLPDNQLVIGTANASSLMQMSDRRAAKGTLVSKPLDAGQVVKWGRLTVDSTTPAGTKATFATRSSNVEDEEYPGWEEWSAEMDAASPQQIASVSARFVQYRLTLETTVPSKTPILRSLTIPRVEENHAPVLAAVELISARDEVQKPTAPSALKTLLGGGSYGAPPPGPKDYWVIKWRAEDPNKDTLIFEAFYRQAGTNRWIRIGKDIKESYKVWDTRTVEDGKYEIRVVAKDTPSNPPGTDLTVARVSDVMVVDNTPPTVKIDRVEPKGAKGFVVHATLGDAATNIAEAAYNLDSDEEWKMLAADDDLFDSPNEAATFTVDDLEPGDHWISLRVRDDRGNTRYVGRTITIGQ